MTATSITQATGPAHRDVAEADPTWRRFYTAGGVGVSSAPRAIPVTC
jgi:hypothetical protein